MKESELSQTRIKSGQVPVYLEELRPKSDIWTLLLFLTLVFFIATITLTTMELYEIYDVTFGIFKKE